MSPNPIVIALASITEFFAKMGIPYMVFGGIANSIYGNPRQTFDIDIKLVLEKDINPFLEEITKIGRIVPEDPKEFLSETNVLPVDIHSVRVDLVVAELPFEKEAIRRSQLINFFGVEVKVCTPEDLIIQKAVSVREKDWVDIKYIIENLKNDLDWDYLLGHCRDLADLLETPEIFHRIKRYRNGSES
ncbi:conserved hypothetical protein [uncultured Desulfobacterium sp.]|uniref:DUF6036 domain-containing protein n=1 Tax=uncultured Desulfobacterium sp. TaxID=201089 RepID=A0A445N052_9BACT|nr:conserved hypothetical protein [uncultured Desulfobacterium sp.]